MGNVAETVVYDSVKDGFISSGYFVDGFKCHLASAAVAGVTATLVASPVDVVKTRYMNAERGRYRGALHCANVTFKTEGAKAFNGSLRQQAQPKQIAVISKSCDICQLSNSLDL